MGAGQFGPELSLPSISIVIPTYNCRTALLECLQSINSQDYPGARLEVLVIDGGSHDGTPQCAMENGAMVLIDETRMKDQEARKAIGLMRASHDIVAYVDSDNILPHRSWLRNMVVPFIEDASIVGAQPWRFGYHRAETVSNRYFALIGGTDTVVYYLGKQDHLSWAETNWNLYGNVTDSGRYLRVVFNVPKIPSLGGNGFFIRRDLLLKSEWYPPERFSHIDVNYDLIRLGHRTYAMVKESVLHRTCTDLIAFFKKRARYAEMYHLSNRERRHRLYTKEERVLLLGVVLISLSFVKPLLDSIRGYKRIRDPAWFLHPIVCAVTVLVYAYASCKLSLTRKWTRKPHAREL